VKVEELYQEIILDHYRAKHHSGLREPYEAEVHHVNPSCGDELTLRVHLDFSAEDGQVSDVSYEGVGCSISQASTSVMTDLVIGRDIDSSLELYDEFLTMMQGQGRVEPDEDRLEDGIAFAGVAKFPARVKCALLGWAAFKDAVLVAQTKTANRQEGRS
jgi:nitrogen fixation protein NifU and related proteins